MRASTPLSDATSPEEKARPAGPLSATSVALPRDVTRTDGAPRLVCAEVWGGNRPIDVPLKLPGIRGRVYSRPCAGGRGGEIPRFGPGLPH